MMLNKKLKSNKKSLKKQAKSNKKNLKQANSKKEKLGKSKFFEKYSERMESIKESDIKQEERKKQMQENK